MTHSKRARSASPPRPCMQAQKLRRETKPLDPLAPRDQGLPKQIATQEEQPLPQRKEARQSLLQRIKDAGSFEGSAEPSLLKRIQTPTPSWHAKKRTHSTKKRKPNALLMSVNAPARQRNKVLANSASVRQSSMSERMDLPISYSQGNAPTDKASKKIFSDMARAFKELEGATNLIIM